MPCVKGFYGDCNIGQKCYQEKFQGEYAASFHQKAKNPLCTLLDIEEEKYNVVYTNVEMLNKMGGHFDKLWKSQIVS